MDKTKIIVVEDNIVYCEYVCNMLSREGYHTMKAYHLSTAKKHLQQATDNDIVVADLRLPDGNGIDLLRWMRKEGKMQPFIIMTDYAEVHTAVESMKLGSIDYIPKQLVEDKLVPLLRSIQKERQAGQRRMPVFAREGSAFQKIMHRIRLLAATDMSVMIFGENGTGKEHIAHHLHDKSKRAGKPFVAVDCGSLTKELAPSAFFGHVKGAFTGADSTKKGYFYEAEGGTLFLDEVGNLALETQQMLLRAIQERRYRPIGDKSDRSFNVRIIAATNAELLQDAQEGSFREDLYYRLAVITIRTPPLRRRKSDLPLLAVFFLTRAAESQGLPTPRLSRGALRQLQEYHWPGNVRELQNCLTRALAFCENGLIFAENIQLGPDTLPGDIARPERGKLSCPPARADNRQPSGDAAETAEPPAVQPAPAGNGEQPPAAEDAPPRLNARLARLLPRLVELGSVSRQEYQDMAGKDISMRTAQYDLQTLVRLGLVRREGRGPAQRYIVLPAARGFRA